MDAWFGRHLATFTPEAFDVIEASILLAGDRLREYESALQNLLANALDAVANHGTIAVTLWGLEQGGRTMLNVLVEDNGPGIPPEHRPHLFEPFFTTKRDFGTGLGL